MMVNRRGNTNPSQDKQKYKEILKQKHDIVKDHSYQQKQEFTRKDPKTLDGIDQYIIELNQKLEEL